MKAINRIGQRFGRLVIVKQTTRVGPQRGTWVIGRCDCGRWKQVRVDTLVQGVTRSCGCLRSETSAAKRGQTFAPRRQTRVESRVER